MNNKIAICVLIYDPNNFNFLSVSLKDDHTDLNLPGGNVKKNEDIIDAGKREVKEETGLDIYNLKYLYESVENNYNVITYYTSDYSGKIYTIEDHVVKWIPLYQLTKSKKWPDYNNIIYNMILEIINNI